MPSSADSGGDVVQKRQEKIQALKQGRVRLYPNDFKVRHTCAELLALAQAPPSP